MRFKLGRCSCLMPEGSSLVQKGDLCEMLPNHTHSMDVTEKPPLCLFGVFGKFEYFVSSSGMYLHVQCASTRALILHYAFHGGGLLATDPSEGASKAIHPVKTCTVPRLQ